MTSERLTEYYDVIEEIEDFVADLEISKKARAELFKLMRKQNKAAEDAFHKLENELKEK